MTHHTDKQLAAISAQQDAGVPPAQFVVPPDRRKKRRNEESAMQQHLIRWWAQHCTELGVPVHLLMSIPNGGRRDAITGALLKKEGCRAGAPDLLLAVPRDNAATVTSLVNNANSPTGVVQASQRYRIFHALFIEMKRPDGYTSMPQREMLADLEKQGYLTAVCRSFEDAKRVITEYLSQ